MGRNKSVRNFRSTRTIGVFEMFFCVYSHASCEQRNKIDRKKFEKKSKIFRPHRRARTPSRRELGASACTPELGTCLKRFKPQCNRRAARAPLPPSLSFFTFSDKTSKFEPQTRLFCNMSAKLRHLSARSEPDRYPARFQHTNIPKIFKYRAKYASNLATRCCAPFNVGRWLRLLR